MSAAFQSSAFQVSGFQTGTALPSVIGWTMRLPPLRVTPPTLLALCRTAQAQSVRALADNVVSARSRSEQASHGAGASITQSTHIGVASLQATRVRASMSARTRSLLRSGQGRQTAATIASAKVVANVNSIIEETPLPIYDPPEWDMDDMPLAFVGSFPLEIRQ